MRGADSPHLYLFGWPSHLGGADTKLAHLLRLLHGQVEITVVPNDPARLGEDAWTGLMDQLGIRYTTFDALPKRLSGNALALSNQRFFTDRIAHRAREKGLRIIWSSEMMWHHEGELEAVEEGIIDKVLYVSEFQKEQLAEGYGSLPFHITGNYIDPEMFPFHERRNPVFTIGRLSRAAPEKYPEDFPVFYECLGIPEVRFRVMAWSEALTEKYRWHRFDDRWDLLSAEAEEQVPFLHSLDLFVYPLGHRFKESWGRSTVEAMLTGCIPLVPTRHQFENLIVHGETGFICGDFAEYHEHANRLALDLPLRRLLAERCRVHAVRNLCDRKQHIATWMEVLA